MKWTGDNWDTGDSIIKMNAETNTPRKISFEVYLF
jgi:hypothetical protein